MILLRACHFATADPRDESLIAIMDATGSRTYYHRQIAREYLCVRASSPQDL